VRSPDRAYLEPLAPQRPVELGVLPHRWRCRELRDRAEAVGGSPLALVNPGLSPPARTTRTLACAITHLGPGARPSRAPSGAGVRVVVEGQALYTPPSGRELALARNDLVRTRDVRHGEWRAGDAGALWLDAVDQPLVSAIGADGPTPSPCDRCPFPRVHRWTQTEAVLGDGGVARFGSPASGGDLTRTLRVEVHRLRAGLRTPSVHASHSAVVLVLAGSGTSVVGGWLIGWDAGDVFVVPPGTAADHRPGVTSDLLIVSDAPALARLGLWWSETEPERQPIEDTLD
jgi:gentisate 1,2-dioxygenase